MSNWQKPGGGLSQSLNVRIGTSRRMTLIMAACLHNIDPKAWLAEAFACMADSHRAAYTSCCRGIGRLFTSTVLRSGGVAMHFNKVHSVFTIGRGAKDLGEDEDWLWDVANGMDSEGDVIWVYSIGDEGVMAFTDSANLMELIRMHKEDPEPLRRWNR
jgi:hypothetical protein